MLGLGGCETGQVSTAAVVIVSAAAVTLLGDIVAAAGSDVVVGNVATVLSLVPDCVAVDGGAGRLAGDCNVGSLPVALDYRVGGSWTRAAVDAVAGDGVGIGDGCEGSNCQCHNGSEHHFEWMLKLYSEYIVKLKLVLQMEPEEEPMLRCCELMDRRV